ncbi:hypothetical protein O181_111643 [Austropuccinia psidii MF-1]|uniref:Uncharacterized protein n=1 Tax=Austropuccinia psidii MF-1 TaxID=1389203 RepID=A0A9Q3JYX9_9BASI|nr:hypothetical protein [Austropuccinia psidii MF-1]
MSSTDRINQKILEMQEKLLALLKKEGKNKSSCYTPQSSPLKKQTTLPRSFRLHGSPSLYPRLMATLTLYTEQRQNTLPRRVNISAQIPTPLHKEIPRNTTPIVKIRAKDYNLWFDGKDAEILIKKVENIEEIEGASGRDIARKIAFWTKDEEISSHIEGICTQLAEDLDRRIVRTQGASYLFRNYQRVPMEGNESGKNIVRAFAKEQEELHRKFMEKPTSKPKPEEEVKPTEKKSEVKSTSIAHVEDWSNWKPPTISSTNDPFKSHI